MDQGQRERNFDSYLPIRTIFTFSTGFVSFAWQNLSHVDSAHPAKSKCLVVTEFIVVSGPAKIHCAAPNLRIPAVKTLQTVTGRASAHSARTMLLTIGCLAFAGAL